MAAWANSSFRVASPRGTEATSDALTSLRKTRNAQNVIYTRLRNVLQASSIAAIAFGSFANAQEKAAAKRGCYQMLEGMGTELPKDLSAVLAAA